MPTGAGVRAGGQGGLQPPSFENSWAKTLMFRAKALWINYLLSAASITRPNGPS